MTYNKDSKSSFLPISYPLCAAIDAYLVVPINDFLSLNGLLNKKYFNTYVFPFQEIILKHQSQLKILKMYYVFPSLYFLVLNLDEPLL